jgi:hypothetical protein
MARIALVQLCSAGDCLYASVVARQIKKDHPDCHLTWVVGDRYASVLDLNPDVDSVHVVPIADVRDAINGAWQTAKAWTRDQIAGGNLDKAYYTQICPDNIWLYDGLIRSTIYRAYGKPVENPHRPTVVLSDLEEARAAAFVRDRNLTKFKHLFLFECGPQSQQSSMHPLRAVELAKTLSKRHPDAAFVLSSSLQLTETSAQVIDASGLTFRENLPLMRYCTGLIGCSSGLTWLSTSASCKTLPMLQVLAASSEPFKFASVAADFRRFGGDVEQVIEMADPNDKQILDCMESWINESHSAARKQFHQTLRIGSIDAAALYVVVRRKFGALKALQTLVVFLRTNGISNLPARLLLTEPFSFFMGLFRRILPSKSN